MDERARSTTALPYGSGMGLWIADRIADAALNTAAELGCAVTVTVVDSAGDVVALRRMDGAHRASIEVSVAKARCSARFKRPTLAFAQANHGALSLPGVVAVEGGVPVVRDGLIVGAVGVSGALPTEDGAIAQAAATA